MLAVGELPVERLLGEGATFLKAVHLPRDRGDLGLDRLTASRCKPYGLTLTVIGHTDTCTPIEPLGRRNQATLAYFDIGTLASPLFVPLSL